MQNKDSIKKDLLDVTQAAYLAEACARLDDMLLVARAERFAPTFEPLMDEVQALILGLLFRIMHIGGGPLAVVRETNRLDSARKSIR